MSAGGSNEPNLTPFIDLFSVLICFLLMTSAWIQLESMPSSIEAPKKEDGPAEFAPPPPPNNEKKTKLAVSVYPDRVILKENENEIPVFSSSTGFNKEQIKTVLEQWRGRFPEKKDIVLNTEAGVTYGSLIKMYDLLVASDWPDVGINPQ